MQAIHQVHIEDKKTDSSIRASVKLEMTCIAAGVAYKDYTCSEALETAESSIAQDITLLLQDSPRNDVLNIILTYLLLSVAIETKSIGVGASYTSRMASSKYSRADTAYILLNESNILIADVQECTESVYRLATLYANALQMLSSGELLEDVKCKLLGEINKLCGACNELNNINTPKECKVQHAAPEKETSRVYLENNSKTFYIPVTAKRIILVANSGGMVLDTVAFQKGDHIIHCNRARNYNQILEVLKNQGLANKVTHGLLIRCGRTDGVRTWFTPSTFDGFEYVSFFQLSMVNKEAPWYVDYKKSRSLNPTTGFLAYNMVMDAVRGIPVILLGYDAGRKHSTFRWSQHDWEYESNVVEYSPATVLRPFNAEDS